MPNQFDWMQVGMLFLLDWDAEALQSVGTVGLLVFSDVGEFAWKVRRWPVPHIDWCTVVDEGLNAPETPGLRALFMAGKEPQPPIEGEAAPPYRFSVSLVPDHAAKVTFRSACYYSGKQLVGDGQAPYATFTAETEWRAASYWPR